MNINGKDFNQNPIGLLDYLKDETGLLPDFIQKKFDKWGWDVDKPETWEDSSEIFEKPKYMNYLEQKINFNVIANSTTTKPFDLQEHTQEHAIYELAWSLLINNTYYSPIKRGILLFGNIGCGKTTMFKIFSRLIAAINQYNEPAHEFDNIRDSLVYPLYIVLIEDLIDDFQTGGYDKIDHYITKNNVCFDDMGREPEKAQYMGNATELMSKIIAKRYNQGLLTHITSNLTPEEFFARYSLQTVSRIKEITEMYKYPGKDRRG